jgi:hypothetical protein
MLEILPAQKRQKAKAEDVTDHTGEVIESVLITKS